MHLPVGAELAGRERAHHPPLTFIIPILKLAEKKIVLRRRIVGHSYEIFNILNGLEGVQATRRIPRKLPVKTVDATVPVVWTASGEE
jgi:hypothetical protein